MKLCRWLTIVVSLLLLIACSHSKLSQKDTKSIDLAVRQNPINTPSDPFTLGEGDEISINVWRNQDLNRTVQLDPSGYVSFPMVGQIKASGLTVEQLRQEITTKLAKYFVNPQVDITLTKLRSKNVYVLGEVRSPGGFVLDQKMYAWEAIAKAGGFTNEANKRAVLLIRQEKETIRANLLNMNIMDTLEKGEIDKYVYAKSGDIVYVPPTKIADIGKFMTTLDTIVRPFTNIQRAIIFMPDVIDALSGKSTDRGVVVAP